MERIGYYEGVTPDNNVASFLQGNAEAQPEATAYHWVTPDELQRWMKDKCAEDPIKHQRTSFREFAEGVERVAGGLHSLGLSKGDCVLLFLPMSVALYTAMAGLQRIGAVPVFLDSWARRDELDVSAQVVNAKAMISFEIAFELAADSPTLKALTTRIVFGPVTGEYTARLEKLIQHPDPAPIEPVAQEDTALITFTTGSSGTPKGANRTHRFLAAQHKALDEFLPYTENDVDLPAFPIFSLNNIAAGVSTVIPAIDVGTPADHDNSLLLAQMNACQVTCTTLSPWLLNSIAAECHEHGHQLTGLRRAATGGAPISRDNLADFKSIAPHAEVWVLYGSTEVEPIAHIEAQEMFALPSRSAEDAEWVEDGVNVGHPVSVLRIKFLQIHPGPIEVQTESDWASLEVGTGEVGELIVAGEHVCRDYYNNPEAFCRAKIRDTDGTIWHRTGDLARLDDNGFLWMVGRVHNTIQRDGQYVFPIRAEMVLQKLPFVRQAAYLGLPDTKLKERTVCVVALNTVERPQQRTEIERIMKKHDLPVDELHIVDEIPMDPRHHSKVEYDTLRQQLDDTIA
ncbi:MAG: AMP-binding protein [Pedosphaera sp.]|jgi:acyl-CoA synthetase (AMP-forming)/AMP-acid ligase II|nr:AMP-binding protein [Pedosphaera sp.]|tara:strand:- start:1124 stop:2830 length:1707 start_codon:yes stop_codon:yes gene_type:complete